MQPGVSAPASRAGWIGAASATAAIAAYVVACLVTGVSVDVRERDSAILIFGALALAAAALVGWRRAMGRADAAVRALEEERTQQVQAERELRDVARARDLALVRERDRFRNDLSREEARAEGLERLHTAERRWHATLRDRVEGMHRQEGGEGDLDRVREVLLGTSLELSGATKGILITRRPGDVGGHMDVVAAQGVEPAAGEAQAERFAADPIPAETVIREKGDLGDTVVIPIHQRDRFHGVLIAAGRRGGFAEHDDAVLVAVGEHIGAILQTERVNAELRESYVGALRMLAEAIDAKDPMLHGHSAEVARFATAMGRRLDIEPDEQRLLSLASLLHDVGTVGVSERVLLKPGPLNAQEREVVEEHPRIGAQVVSQVPALRPLAPAILHHHERYDGTGYPNGLAGDDIPVPARLIAVADAFSAMMHDRPHRSARSVDEACAVLERGAGTAVRSRHGPPARGRGPRRSGDRRSRAARGRGARLDPAPRCRRGRAHRQPHAARQPSCLPRRRQRRREHGPDDGRAVHGAARAAPRPQARQPPRGLRGGRRPPPDVRPCARPAGRPRRRDRGARRRREAGAARAEDGRARRTRAHRAGHRRDGRGAGGAGDDRRLAIR